MAKSDAQSKIQKNANSKNISLLAKIKGKRQAPHSHFHQVLLVVMVQKKTIFVTLVIFSKILSLGSKDSSTKHRGTEDWMLLFKHL